MLLHGLGWRGGKTAYNGTTGPWVASLLPQGNRIIYMEPFAGMLGVLLQRTPAQVEVVNDIDGRIINWWRHVRDEPDAMVAKLQATPRSRAEFDAACLRLQEHADSLQAAIDFTVVVCQSIMPGSLGAKRWGRQWRLPAYGRWTGGIEDRMHALADRLRDVHIECGDAIEICEAVKNKPDVVLYADPPYRDTAGYGHDVDRDALRDTLLAQHGRVAISGYGDEWDHLGWERHERSEEINPYIGAPRTSRQDVLWTNYEPLQARLL